MNKCHYIFKYFISIMMLLLLIGCIGNHTFRSNATIAKNQLLASFPFQELTGGVILVKVNVDDFKDSLNFIFDTGNTGLSIDSTTAKELDLNIVATNKVIRGIAGEKPARFTYQHFIHFPGWSTGPYDMHISDYGLFEQVYGQRIDGIIGYSFFKQYIIKINYDKHQIECYAPGANVYPKGGYFLPINLYKFPVNMVQLEGRSAVDSKTIFDLGAGLNYLVSKQLLNEHPILPVPTQFYPTQVEGFGGKKVIDLTVVKKMSIGKYMFKKVPIHVFEDESNILNYPNLGGILGTDLLRRFNIVLDYPAEKIHIKPNTRFRDRFDYHYSGLSFYMIDGSITIVDIIQGSPGDLYGFEVDDIVVAIDGNLVSNLHVLKDKMELKQHTHQFGILRNGLYKVVKIKLQNIKKQN